MELAMGRIDDTSGRFILSGCTPAFANSFRREMIGGVAKLAIEDVKIYDNTSALFDEMLAHRLGLIPLRTERSVHVPAAECACEGVGCPACTAIYTLSVEGPRMVTSGDLIPQDPSTGPVDDRVPIVKLTQDQKVVLEAKAVMATGRQHAKWQPTLTCGYKNYPVITVDEHCDGCGMCVEECPRGVLAVRNEKVSVVKTRLEDCSLCRLCERKCFEESIGGESSIRVTPDETRFVFQVESDGSLAVLEIVETALRHLKQKALDLETILSEVSEGESHAATS